MITSGFDPELVPLEVSVDDTMIRVKFKSGLELATPVARFPRLAKATAEQRKSWRMIGRGDGIHWPEVDEDISMRGLFFTVGAPPANAMEEVPSLIGDLYKTTRRLNSLFEGRPFTPDGHLVGSIGEVVAEYVYGLRLEPCSTPRIDARTDDKRSVQIKLTGGDSYGIRWSSQAEVSHPDLLICLRLTSEGFEEVYNGPFPVDLLRAKRDQSNGQVSLSVSLLRKLKMSVLPQLRSLESVNRWFKPQMTNVA